MAGFIDDSQVAIKLDNSKEEVQNKLDQLRDEIVSEYNLRKPDELIWEKQRDEFIIRARKINTFDPTPLIT